MTARTRAGSPLDHQQGSGRLRRLGWTLVPVLSWSMLAFLPFLRLAIARRRARDWLVFGGYFWAVLLEITGFVRGLAFLELGLPILLMTVAAVHTFIEFDPARTPKPARNAPPGWYRDPGRRYAQRWWTGLGWSAWVRQGGVQSIDPLPPPGPAGIAGPAGATGSGGADGSSGADSTGGAGRSGGGAGGGGAGGGGAGGGGVAVNGAAAELAHLHYLEEFLDRARTEHVVSSDAYRALLARVASREESLAGFAPAAPAAAPALPARERPADGAVRLSSAPEGGAVPSATAAPPVRPPTSLPPSSLPPSTPWQPPLAVPPAAPSPPPARPAPVRAPAPGVVTRRVRIMRAAVQADLAVHGLAYLGVLLLFAGLFGMVAFSFSSVRVGFRPVAELVAPAAVLGSAWLLARRKLVVPARALVLLGGLLLLVVVLAAFVDDAPIPPDPSGIPLVVALSAAPAALAVAYALWVRRRPASSLRHLVAPALWLAVAMAALGWYEPIPTGRDIVIPRPGQVAAVLAAITLTLAVSRTRMGRRLPAAIFPAGLIGLGIAALLEALAAGYAGWPAVPVAVSGAAAVVALELSVDHLPGVARTVLEGLVIVLTGFALVPGLGVGWAGASAAVAGVAVIELAARRAVPLPASLVPMAVVVAGAAAAAWRPGPLLVATGAVSVWAQLRRLWPDRWPYPVLLLTVTAAVAPAGVLVGLAGVVPVDLGTAVAGLLVLSCGICARALARPADRFWSWWMPGAAAAVLAMTAGQDATAWVIVAAAAAAATVAVSPLPAYLRVWFTGAAALWTAWLTFEVADIGFPARMLGIAGAAVVAVAFAALRRDRVAGQIGSFGHLAGVACWPLAAFDAGSLNSATPAAVLGLAAAGAVLTTAAQEAGHAAVPDLLVRCGTRLSGTLAPRYRGMAESALRMAPAVAAVILLIPFVAWLPALVDLGVPAPWWPLAISALGLAYVLLARVLQPWHRVARVLADAGPWTAVLAAVGCERRDSALAALAVVMVLPVLAAPGLRRRATAWIGWAASVPFIDLAANLAGLPESYWYAATLGWGAVLLIGGLGTDDVRAGRRPPGAGVRLWWLLPPVVVGAIASLAGLVGSVSGSVHQVGWALIAAAITAAAAGVLLHAGVLGGVAAAMAIAGLEAVLPWSLPDRVWLLLATAAALLVAAEVARPRTATAVALWRRWDISLFAMAHASALTALGVSLASSTSVAATSVGCGGLALAVAARRRRWEWAVAGVALILAGSAEAGAGWTALAFAGVAVLATALAVGRQGWPRTLLQVTGALAASGAWAAALVWRDTTLVVTVEASSVAAAALVLTAATGARISQVARDWARVWGGLAMAVTLACAVALASPAVPAAARFFVAAALAATAVGCALAAGPLRLPVLRETSAAAALAAALALAKGGTADLHVMTWGATAAGLVVSGIILVPWTRRAAPGWVRPAVIVAAAATMAALAGGVAALPDRTLLVPACVLAAVLVVVLAVVLRVRGLAAATPVPLCAAWLAYASEALTGQPQWYTVPTGAAILAVAGLLRSARRASGHPVATPDVVALEITGMAMVMAASLVQGFTRGPTYDLLGACLGLALAVWGARTHVRRRLLGGTVAFGISMLLLIAVPLVAAIPQWSGVVGWLILAGVGVVAIAAAALLDVTRAAVRRGAARLADLTKGWE